VLAAVPAKAQDQQSSGQNQDQQGQQDQNQSQGATPIPAYHSPLASAADNGGSEPAAELPAPDTRSLAGAQILTVAGPETVHSYWQPHIDVSGTGDSNPQESTGGNSWGTWVSISGGVDLHRTATDSDLTLTYEGGGTFSSGNSVNNGIVQQLGVTERIALRRWTLSFFDQVSYLPEAGFGYGGLGGTALSTGSAGLGSTFTNGQTILTGQGQSVTNSFVTEADFALTPRASFTFVGGYSILRYFDSGLLNSGDATFRAGYNYLWSRKDTLAAFYTYSAFRYTNSSQSIDEHTIEASYARRVTGRLSFQVAAGPQVVLFHEPPTSGSGSGGVTTPNSSTQLYWALDTSTQYRWERTMLGAAYDHGVTSGSGVLAGSVTDTASGSATRQMSRTFSSGITGGYSRNKGLEATTGVPTSQIYDYWFVGANFSRPWGRSLGLTFSYQLQYQNSNARFCIGETTCGTSVIRHLISVGLGWHERPIVF
jgi:hypothetical protein